MYEDSTKFWLFLQKANVFSFILQYYGSNGGEYIPVQHFLVEFLNE